MGNATTDHSKRLRAESARAWRKKVLDEGGLNLSIVLQKEYADIVRILAEQEGSQKKAIEFLIDFYKKRQQD